MNVGIEGRDLSQIIGLCVFLELQTQRDATSNQPFNALPLPFPAHHISASDGNTCHFPIQCCTLTTQQLANPSQKLPPQPVSLPQVHAKHGCQAQQLPHCSTQPSGQQSVPAEPGCYEQLLCNCCVQVPCVAPCPAELTPAVSQGRSTEIICPAARQVTAQDTKPKPNMGRVKKRKSEIAWGTGLNPVMVHLRRLSFLMYLILCMLLVKLLGLQEPVTHFVSLQRLAATLLYRRDAEH